MHRHFACYRKNDDVFFSTKYEKSIANFLVFDQYLIWSKIYKHSKNGNKTTFQDFVAKKITFDIQYVKYTKPQNFPINQNFDE